MTQFLYVGNSAYLRMAIVTFENFLVLVDYFWLRTAVVLYLYCKVYLRAMFIIQLLNAASASCQELPKMSPLAQGLSVLEAI